VIAKEGITIEGISREGITSEGISREGIDKRGITREGIDKRRDHERGITREGSRERDHEGGDLRRPRALTPTVVAPESPIRTSSLLSVAQT